MEETLQILTEFFEILSTEFGLKFNPSRANHPIVPLISIIAQNLL